MSEKWRFIGRPSSGAPMERDLEKAEKEKLTRLQKTIHERYGNSGYPVGTLVKGIKDPDFFQVGIGAEESLTRHDSLLVGENGPMLISRVVNGKDEEVFTRYAGEGPHGFVLTEVTHNEVHCIHTSNEQNLQNGTMTNEIWERSDPWPDPYVDYEKVNIVAAGTNADKGPDPTK